jgi:hypothetical protein
VLTGLSAIGQLEKFQAVTQLLQRLATAAGLVGVVSAGDAEMSLGILDQMLPTKAKRDRTGTYSLPCIAYREASPSQRGFRTFGGRLWCGCR